MPLSFRPVDVDDKVSFFVVSAIQAESARTDCPAVNIDISGNAAECQVFAKNGYLYWVGYVNGNPAAVATVHYDGTGADVSCLPEFRRSGIVRALLEHLESELADQGNAEAAAMSDQAGWEEHSPWLDEAMQAAGWLRNGGSVLRKQLAT